MDSSERFAYLQMSLRDGFMQACLLNRQVTPSEVARAERLTDGRLTGAPCLWCGQPHLRWAAKPEEVAEYARVHLALIWAVRDVAMTLLQAETDPQRRDLYWRLWRITARINRAFVPGSSSS